MFPIIGSRVGRNKWAGAYPCISPVLTKVKRAANQSIGNGAWTTVSWDTLLRDDVGAWNNGSPTIITNPGPFTRVMISLSTGWANNSSGGRFHSILQNGTDICLDLRNAIAEANACWGTGLIDTAPGDQFKINVNQTSGGSLNFSGTGFPRPSELEFEWFR